MSFFFGKSQSDDNLQYDDTASLHFAITVSIITSTVFLVLIIRDLKGKKKPGLQMAKKMPSFKQKITNTDKNKKNYFRTTEFLYKFGIIVAFTVFGIYCFSNIKEDSKMIGFDPYEILGVSMDAQINTIKKAYRKLALQYHPDRNVNNPEVGAKFIQISKAYECLTDEQAKQKCKKYGNPDGQTSFKVGIGLPRFMVDMQNQYFILIPIFIVLLVIIPRAFIKWSNKLKPMDDNGNLLVNYNMFFRLMNPAMNPITFSVILGSMKQLDAIFPENKTLQPQLQQGMKALLTNTRAIPPQYLQTIAPHILYRICAVYSHMSGRQISKQLAEHFPDLCKKIIMFAINFSQKGRNQKAMYNRPQWTIHFFGDYIVHLSIFFCKQMFNPQIRLGDTKSIQFLDLTPQEQLMCKNIPIGNLQENLLWDDQKIKVFIQNFQKDRQEYVGKQIQALPALKVQSRVLLGEEQVTQMTIDDFAMLQIKVIRKKPYPGYVMAKDFPLLARQQFYLILSYNHNIILFKQINFKKGSNEVVFKCEHRQAFVKNMKFNINVLSNCYPNMDIQTQLNLNVIGRIQNRKIQIHKDDLNIDRMPKSFFESLASMDAYNESDKQLSDGSDNQQQQQQGPKVERKKRSGFQEQEPQAENRQKQSQKEQKVQKQQHSHQGGGGCCGDVGQKPQSGFRQQPNDN